MQNSPKTKGIGITFLYIASLLLTASLALVGILESNSGAAAQTNLFKFHFQGSSARLEDSTTVPEDCIADEPCVATTVRADAFESESGDPVICLQVIKFDVNLGISYIEFAACSVADELSLANGLGSGTFSGTVTGFDIPTGQEMSFTVEGDLTATGNPERTNFRFHDNSETVNSVLIFNGIARTASGSLGVTENNIDFSFSSDDATGYIGKSTSSSIAVQKP